MKIGMATNRVRVGTRYVYHANLLDRVDGRTGLKDGEVVTVINLTGAPKANTMGHCYVEDVCGLIGMVHCNSLHTFAEYKEYLRDKITAIENTKGYSGSRENTAHGL